MNNEEFNEQTVYKKFKIIRNRIRYHFPKQIVFTCIKRLNLKFDTNEEYIQEIRKFPPWILFLLIKWTIIYGEYLEPDRKILTEKDFLYLIKLMHDYWNVQKSPSDYENNYLFFRTIAYQQFWLNSVSDVNEFGRQQKLFANLPSNHYLNKTFQQETNICIEDFIELAYSLYIRFINRNEQYVNKQWFASIENSYPKGTVNSFLSTISKEWSDIKTYLKNLPTKEKSNEFHEHTPLTRYPLLKIEDKYYCYSSNLILYNAQNIIYDLLREIDPSKFQNIFGKIFETYIKDVLKNTNLNFLNEDNLKNELNSTKKIVDFVVIERNANIFIEAKSSELNLVGMVSHSSDIVVNRTNNSIIKGVEQYYSTVNQCLISDSIDVKNKENYLIIVTYKDLYLGNGKIFLDKFAKSEYKEIQNKYSNCSFLKSENIYFISIEDYDLLIEMITVKSKTFKDILDPIINSDSSDKNMKFLFRQHLLEIDRSLKHIKYLEKHYNELADNCQNKLNSNKKPTF